MHSEYSFLLFSLSRVLQSVCNAKVPPHLHIFPSDVCFDFFLCSINCEFLAPTPMPARARWHHLLSDSSPHRKLRFLSVFDWPPRHPIPPPPHPYYPTYIDWVWTPPLLSRLFLCCFIVLSCLLSPKSISLMSLESRSTWREKRETKPSLLRILKGIPWACVSYGLIKGKPTQRLCHDACANSSMAAGEMPGEPFCKSVVEP